MLLCILSGLFAMTNGAKSSLDILVMADWGGSEKYPYSTPDEVDSAKIMNEVASTFNVDAVWGLGDNFYDNGVKNEYDARFKETFEDVFDGSSLKNVPFYIVAGNHDHNGNVSGQIFYSNHSSRWIFPNYYFSETFKVPNTSYTLQLVMIDTVILSGMTYDTEYCDKHGISEKECLIHPKGPEDKELAKTQYQWIEETLAASTASFIVVCGHYPIYSVAEHGSTSDLVKNLKPMLLKYNVTSYMSGHDHTFEYINSGDGVDYIDTGGTHVCNPSTSNTNTIPKGSLKFHGCNDGGFTRIRVDYTGLSTFYYFGNENKVQYSVDTRKPRNI